MWPPGDQGTDVAMDFVDRLGPRVFVVGLPLLVVSVEPGGLGFEGIPLTTI